MSYRPGFHRCPRRGCQAQVPNSLFACLPDWNALPAEAKRGIYATARLSLFTAERQQAVRAARMAWGDL
jgi:hypothetical protein